MRWGRTFWCVLVITALFTLGWASVATAQSAESSDDGVGAQAVATAEAAAAKKPLVAKGDPIIIGLQNPEGDPNGSFPEYTVGAQAAVQYINNQLGGIGANYEKGTPGRPIQLEVCKMAIAPAESQRCANELVSKKPFAVISTLNFFGNHYPIYKAANIPVLVGTPVVVPDFTTEGIYAIGGGGGCLGLNVGRVDYVTRSLKKRRIAVGWINTSAGRVCYNAFEGKALSVLAGKNPDGSDVVATGNTLKGTMPNLQHTNVVFQPAQTDMTSQVTQILDYKPDEIQFSGQLSDCWTFFDTLTRLGWTTDKIPLTISSGCVDITRLKALGSAAKGINFVGAVPVVEPKNLSGQLKTEATNYQKAMAKYAPGSDPNKGFTSIGFSLPMMVWELANEQVNGKPASLDAAKFTALVAATKNHHSYLGTPMSCAEAAKNPPYVSVCATTVTASQWDGKKLKVKESNFSGFDLIKGTTIS